MNIYLAGGQPQIESACKKMKIYIASPERIKNDCKKVGADERAAQFIYSGANILQSFYYCNKITETLIIPNAKRFLLDSGAFTLFTSGKAVDWEEYINRYAKFINRNRIERFFELDVDSLVGYNEVLKMRERLTKLTGKKPIPVWHKSRGKDEFIKMCADFDYVAIGGIVSKEITRNEYKYFPWFINTAHKAGAKIHGLGFTDLEGLKKYHFDSVDSTSWVSGNRFGRVYKFDGKTMVKVVKQPGQRVKTNEAAINNFTEWKKFAQYAETKL